MNLSNEFYVTNTGMSKADFTARKDKLRDQHPELYTLESCRETLLAKAQQGAWLDEGEDYTFKYLCVLVALDFFWHTEEFTDEWLRKIVMEAYEKRRQECGGKIITVQDILEKTGEMAPEERFGKEYHFVLGPRDGEKHGLFAKGSLHLIQGSSGAGKTTLGLNMLKAQYDGKPYFNRPARWRDYLVVWQDRSEGELVRQLDMLGMTKCPPPYTLVTDKQMNMEPAKALAEILAEVQQRSRRLPEVLFVEGLDMWVSDAKDMKEVRNSATNVRKLAEDTHISIIATVGMPKMKPKERYTAARDRAFGSSAWARLADTIVDVTVDEEDHVHWGQIRRIQVLSRTMRAQRFDMAFDPETGLLVPVEPSITVGPAPAEVPAETPIPTWQEIAKSRGVGRRQALEIRRRMKDGMPRHTTKAGMSRFSH